MAEQSAIQRRLHNDLAGKVVASIVRPVVDAGGSAIDILILLESVTVGVMLVAAKLGGDEIVVDAFTERVKERLAELRLGGLPPEGSA